MKKLTLCAAALAFLLAGCDGQNTANSASAGNFTAKQETLSSANAADIKADLAQFNGVINSANSEAVSMRDELMKANSNNDKSAATAVLKKSQSLQESTNAKLIALTLKSQEVQGLRLKIVEGNMKAIAMAKIASKDTLSDADRKELGELGKQSVVLQMQAGTQLNELNSQYSK
ncbi:hypothetical protein GWD52_09815 [Enterobacteriaceae bacterium 4M9]|nr:hypothetical protein [Enterobacteriaceae bacterium 4M9]